MAGRVVQINRAPVLTLWAAVVAERLGFDRDEALTLGKAVAGLNAQSKGRRLGIFSPSEEKPERARRHKRRHETFRIDLCNRAVPATNTDRGFRATIKGRPVDPRFVEHYLGKKFGDDLDAATAAMRRLADALDEAELADAAFDLYEQFRPQIPRGVKGWGAKGPLDLGYIEQLAEQSG